MKKIILYSLLVFTISLLNLNCSSESKSSGQDSSLLVTDVNHTIVKRQSIGNCWLYAQSSWLESLIKEASGEELDVSESYWTWWYWFDQVVNSYETSVQTGGNWSDSTSIILEHGFVLEEEFIKEEKDVEMSLRQRAAESYMNAALSKGGVLEKVDDRTPEAVRKELDIAFGTDMTKTEKLARKASDTVIAKSKDGSVVMLNEAISHGPNQWKTLDFPAVYGKNTKVPADVKRERADVLRRVMIALNDHWPVVMSVMIDFNALDINDQTFKYSKLKEQGVGTQGGHMVVLEDYTVSDVPGYGTLGEGELSKEEKEAALEGKLLLLKAKNSWGKNRPDRGLTDGYTRFDWQYLTYQLPWKYSEESTEDDVSYYTTLSLFIVPPGY